MKADSVDFPNSELLSRYLEARNYIDVEVVRKEPRRWDPDGKVKAVFEFNRRLGNPQATFPSIQVAGTSGKGSTSLYLAAILHAAGYRTGLHVSPYLQVATEKSWVDGRYAAVEEFHEEFLKVKGLAEEMRWVERCPASVHGMTSLAVSYGIFRRHAVDWCVMETGVGGRYDLIQGLDRRVAVITDIGLDHLRTLGTTIEQIAWHKAGIMAGSKLALAVYSPQSWPVMEEEARAVDCPLEPIHPERLLVPAARGGIAAMTVQLPRLGPVELPCRPGVEGFVGRNMAVAAAVADRLAGMGLAISAQAVSAGLASPPLPGRLELVQSRPEVILDGAHNGQKAAALVATMTPPAGRLHLVLAITGERHLTEVVGAMARPPASVTVTRPLLYAKPVTDPEFLARQLANWCPVVRSHANPRTAVQMAIAAAAPEDRVLVTGSLYLVGQVRDLWYPWSEVLLQRTSYPQGYPLIVR